MIRGMPRRRDSSVPFLAGAFAVISLSLSLSRPSVAADYAVTPAEGVPCSLGQPFWILTGPTAETLPWAAVFYGHFSGGRPYIDVDGRTIIDWRDDHFCFPTSAQCNAWLRASYRAYHQPEGYRACLLLR